MPWEKAKAFDGSAVIGNFYSKVNFKNINNLSFELFKNQILVQKANTHQMLWKVDELIAYISKYMTLKKGDVIFTGTPFGVGAVKKDDILKGFLQGKLAFEVKIK